LILKPLCSEFIPTKKFKEIKLLML